MQGCTYSPHIRRCGWRGMYCGKDVKAHVFAKQVVEPGIFKGTKEFVGSLPCIEIPKSHVLDLRAELEPEAHTHSSVAVTAEINPGQGKELLRGSGLAPVKPSFAGMRSRSHNALNCQPGTRFLSQPKRAHCLSYLQGSLPIRTGSNESKFWS
eukprot:2620123-Rhodomonas_salina.2